MPREPYVVEPFWRCSTKEIINYFVYLPRYVRIATQSLTGKDEGRGDDFDREHPYPGLSPSRGKEIEKRCSDITLINSLGRA